MSGKISIEDLRNLSDQSSLEINDLTNINIDSYLEIIYQKMKDAAIQGLYEINSYKIYSNEDEIGTIETRIVDSYDKNIIRKIYLKLTSENFDVKCCRNNSGIQSISWKRK